MELGVGVREHSAEDVGEWQTMALQKSDAHVAQKREGGGRKRNGKGEAQLSP